MVKIIVNNADKDTANNIAIVTKYDLPEASIFLCKSIAICQIKLLKAIGITIFFSLLITLKSLNPKYLVIIKSSIKMNIEGKKKKKKQN